MHAEKHYTQSAVALAYEEGDLAPRVVAKGSGLLAERIIALAKEHEVFVHESQALLGLLMQVELDDHIPPKLYQAIAEILAWLYQMEHGSGLDSAPPLIALEAHTGNR
ncbi:MAG TPA: EscU/YscU/HrcU family type III secretion system export apparatus switch protein [Methylophilus sp.]